MKSTKFINQMEPWYGKEEKKAILDYLNSGGWLMEFKKTEEFEKMIRNYTGAKYCNVLPNGTMSLVLALMALGIKRGDEVIVPDYTMIATPNAVLMAGAKPIFVDVDDSLCLNPELIKKAITLRTKAVIHVSINGRAGRLDELKKICKNRRIHLIEDAAQSLGSFYRGKHLGRHGVVGSFSFSVPKIITTGQGGALITDSKLVYERVEKLKDFGRVKAGVDLHDEIGWNFKFTDLQAVFGIEQMKKLPQRTELKKNIYQLYKRYLESVKEIKFIETDLDNVSPWFVEILVPNPLALRGHLKDNGIESRVFYPAVHTQPVYGRIEGGFNKLTASNFPVATYAGKHGLWLPSSSFLKDADIKHICKCIKRFF